MVTIFPTGKRRNSSGFTLIEVLVAVVIVTTGIALVLVSFSSSLAALEASHSRMLADSLLKERMDFIHARGIPYPPSGQFRGVNSNYTWQIEVNQPAYAIASDVREVTVTVREQRIGVEYSLSSYKEIKEEYPY